MHLLKSQLHQSGLKQLDKLLIILAASNSPLKIRQIQEMALQAGLNISTWNPATTLSRAKALVINTPDGWELIEAGKQHLIKLGVPLVSASAYQISQDLRTELGKITNLDTKNFVEEAVMCFEHKLFRSAIIMSWIGAMHILYKHTFDNYLAAFNAEALRVDSKWKDAKTLDDFTLMKESSFLDRIAALSIIGKNTKTELVSCLNLRNACGHPNSMKVGPSAAAHHIEALLLNVYAVFAN